MGAGASSGFSSVEDAKAAGKTDDEIQRYLADHPAAAGAAPDAVHIILLGGSGNRSLCQLMTSIVVAYFKNEFPNKLLFTGHGRTSWTDEEFQAAILDPTKKKAGWPSSWNVGIDLVTSAFPDMTTEEIETKAKTLLSSGYEESMFAGVESKFGKEHDGPWNRLIYGSLPGSILLKISANVGKCQAKAPAWTRFIAEKPFGNDLASAKEFNANILAAFNEEQVYRIDHYLGKKPVQDVPRFRFPHCYDSTVVPPGAGAEKLAALDLAKYWSSEHIEGIEMWWQEKQGAMGRVAFGEAGIVRDMLQSHLLEILSLFLLDAPPDGTTAGELPGVLAKAKAKSISELQRLTKDDIKFGCYEGYEEEFDAEAAYHTASFMSVRFKSTSTQWKGMPIYINGGKGTDCRRFGVHVLFKPDCGCSISKLYYEIQPDAAITLTYTNGDEEVLPLTYSLYDPSELLLVQAITAQKNNYVGEELLVCWEVVDDVIDGPGSDGAAPSYASYKYSKDGESDTLPHIIKAAEGFTLMSAE